MRVKEKGQTIALILAGIRGISAEARFPVLDISRYRNKALTSQIILGKDIGLDRSNTWLKLKYMVKYCEPVEICLRFGDL
jgi:hypothetical protein